jgi:hypothetical protein
VKLPFQFDPGKLKQDAQRLGEAEWVAHYNQAIYEGEWSGVALRSAARAHAPVMLYPDPNATEFADTEILGRCPYIQEVLDSFHCPLTSVRILRLRAGAKIAEHRDYRLGYEDGEARIHIPIQTAKEVEFFLDGIQVTMQEGEAWYLNFNLPHRVNNGSSNDRLHLVIDCTVNEWLTEQLHVTEPKVAEPNFAESKLAESKMPLLAG